MPSDQFTAFLEDEQTRTVYPEGARPGLAHRAEKWTRFSAPSDALLAKGSIGWIPKVDSTLKSDARIVRKSGPGFPHWTMLLAGASPACHPRPGTAPPCHPLEGDDAEAVFVAPCRRALCRRSHGASETGRVERCHSPRKRSRLARSCTAREAWADRDRPEKPGGRQNERPVHFIGRETVQGEEEGGFASLLLAARREQIIDEAKGAGVARMDRNQRRAAQDEDVVPRDHDPQGCRCARLRWRRIRADCTRSQDGRPTARTGVRWCSTWTRPTRPKASTRRP